MACRYEEEIYKATGKMDECGCGTCPYKVLGECYEVGMELFQRLEVQRDTLLSCKEPELTEEQRITCRMLAAKIAKESGIPATIGTVPINVAINKALTRAMRVGFLMGRDSLFGFATD